MEPCEAGEAAACGFAGWHRVEHGRAGVAAGSAVGRVHLRVDAGGAARRLARRAAGRADAGAAERSCRSAGVAAGSAVGGRACERGLAASRGVAVAVAEVPVAGDDGAGPCHAGRRPVDDGADASAGPAVGEVGRDARASPAACGLPRHGAGSIRGGVGDVRGRSVRVGAGVAHLRHVGVQHDIALVGRDVGVVIREDVAVLPDHDVAIGDIVGDVERQFAVDGHLVVGRVGGRVTTQVREGSAITSHALEFISAPR